VDLNLLP
jgi:hypothetical protein